MVDQFVDLGRYGCLGMACVRAHCWRQDLFSIDLSVGHKAVDWVAILDLDAFVGYEVKIRGPLYADTHKLRDLPSVFFEPTHAEPRPLSEVAALACFHNLGPVWLGKYITHLGLDVKSTATLFEKLEVLLIHLLPNLTDTRLLEILSLRLKPDEDFELSWDSCELGDVIEADDIQEVSKEGEKEKAQEKTIHAPYKSSFDKKHQAVTARRLKEEGGAGPKNKSKKSSAARAPAAPLATEALRKTDIHVWLPDDEFKVNKDAFNGRWRICKGCPSPPH